MSGAAGGVSSSETTWVETMEMEATQVGTGKVICFHTRMYMDMPNYCLENPMDRGTWWAMAHGVSKSQRRLCDEHFSLFFFSWNAKHGPSISLHALHACSHSSSSQQLHE